MQSERRVSRAGSQGPPQRPARDSYAHYSLITDGPEGRAPGATSANEEAGIKNQNRRHVCLYAETRRVAWLETVPFQDLYSFLLPCDSFLWSNTGFCVFTAILCSSAGDADTTKKGSIPGFRGIHWFALLQPCRIWGPCSPCPSWLWRVAHWQPQLPGSGAGLATPGQCSGVPGGQWRARSSGVCLSVLPPCRQRQCESILPQLSA